MTRENRGFRARTLLRTALRCQGGRTAGDVLASKGEPSRSAPLFRRAPSSVVRNRFWPMLRAREPIAHVGGSRVLSELRRSKYGDGANLRQVQLPAEGGSRAQVQGHDAD